MRQFFCLLATAFFGGSIALIACYYICTTFFEMSFDEALLVTVGVDAAMIVFNTTMAIISRPKKNVKTIDKRN